MSASKLAAIVAIYGAVTLGWVVLGRSVYERTRATDQSLSDEMRSLWGPQVLAQGSPYLSPARDGGRNAAGSVGPSASSITADFRHAHRYKGLLWYSTFTVDFSGRYTIPGAGGGGEAAGWFIFPLPPGVTSYHAMDVSLDGEEVLVPASDVTVGRIVIPVGREVEHVVSVHYVVGGQDAWLYVPGDVQPNAAQADCLSTTVAGGRVSELQGFVLKATTDFADIDYPRGSRAPTEPAQASAGGQGRTVLWEYKRALTSQAMGIAMPHRANAGPIVSRMSFFAPVSLFFFFTVLFAIVVVRHVPLHPMHYLFVAAGFFAFHILMAYLADLLDIHAAFWIAAGVSVFLVASYMRLVAGVKFALLYVSAAQLVYLVGFSYAFFWVGRTGLTVTVGAVTTLFVLMQLTGRVNWNEMFAGRAAVGPPAGPAEAS
jgi:hypothetical protein